MTANTTVISDADWSACVRVLNAIRADGETLEHPLREQVERLAARLNRLGPKARRRATERQRRADDRAAERATVLGSAQPPSEPRSAPPSEPRSAPPRRTHFARRCYMCRTPFRELHFHHHRLCPSCAELNWQMRTRRLDLTGYRALVTGGRVKIGFATALRLLRGGAAVHVTSRFPADAQRRFAAEPDAADWLGRLRVHGLDFRDVSAVLALTDRLRGELDGLEILINNAAQTNRRSAESQAALLAGEAHAALPGGLAALRKLAEHTRAADAEGFLPEANPQRNSWVARVHEVPPVELAEVLLVNTAAPFLLLSRLRGLLRRGRTPDRHVVNVAAAEGRFSRRWKSPAHPHTNMAKAALNMLTRTVAGDLARFGVYVNSVDPGWVSRENPAAVRARLLERDGQPPLDAHDSAARILEPLHRARDGQPIWGVLLKDFRPVKW